MKYEFHEENGRGAGIEGTKGTEATQVAKGKGPDLHAITFGIVF